jgi:hypothetical protein
LCDKDKAAADLHEVHVDVVVIILQEPDIRVAIFEDGLGHVQLYQDAFGTVVRDDENLRTRIGCT